MQKIDDDLMEILRECQIDGSIVKITGQLDRTTYVRLNKCLTAIGGKWNRKLGGHVFDNISKFKDMINDCAYTDEKKEFQFFETPRELAEKMIELADIGEHDVILEPSAGKGAIADVIKEKHPKIKIICVELNEEHSKLLKEKYPTHSGDFLEIVPEYSGNDIGDITKVIMNPPFTKNQDIEHILHAFKFLKTGGTLVSVVSEHPFFANDAKSKLFRDFMAEHDGETVKNMDGAFKSSGTMAHTRLIRITKVKQ